MRVLILVLMALALAAPAFAQAKVGKLDGAAGPTLHGIATPGFGGSEAVETGWVVDWAYVEKLVADGDWQSALGVYQDIRWRSEGADRMRAVEGAATMQEHLNQKAAAIKTYHDLLKTLPEDSAKRNEVMAKMLVMSDLPGQRVLARQLVPALVEGDNWAAWGIEQAVRNEARATLRVNESYGLPYAEELQKKLENWHDTSARREAMAARLAVIPGAGMLYLGDWRAGLGGLAVFIFLIVMVMGTSNRHQWGVAVLWWGVLAAVLLSGPGMAAERARVLAQDDLKTVLQ